MTAPLARAEGLHAAFREGRHFGSLDGLRALSVIAVVWHHTMGHPSDLPALFSNGAHGVTLFFAISGFLIVTLLLRERERNDRIDLRAFYIRRALRIFPLYYAVLAVYVLLVLVVERHSAPGQAFLRNLPYFATYTSNWFVPLDGRVIFYFAWSLAAEEQFYLMWPSVQRFVTPRRALIVMLVVIVGVATTQWAGPVSGDEQSMWFRIVTGIPLAICLGVVFAHLLHDRRSYILLWWLFGWRVSSLVFVALVLWMLGSNGSTLGVHLSMALLVVACVFREDHLLAPLLRIPTLAFVGSISYGVYLLHMLVKSVVAKVLPNVGQPASGYLLFVLTTCFSIAVAAISFRYFESYFMRRKSLYSAKT